MAKKEISVTLRNQWFGPGGVIYKPEDNPHSFPAHYERYLPSSAKVGDEPVIDLSYEERMGLAYRGDPEDPRPEAFTLSGTIDPEPQKGNKGKEPEDEREKEDDPNIEENSPTTPSMLQPASPPPPPAPAATTVNLTNLGTGTPKAEVAKPKK